MLRILNRLQMYVSGRDASYGGIPFLRQKDQIKFLLVQHIAGHWGFPKGHQEGKETPLEAAKREITEETGLENFEVLPTPLFIEDYEFRVWRKRIAKTVTFFLAEVKNETVKVQPEEIQDARWVTFEDGQKLMTFQPGKRILREAWEYLKKR